MNPDLQMFGRSATVLSVIECPTKRDCYIGGHVYGKGGGVFATIASTRDGGRNWRKRKVGSGSNGDSEILDISCWSATCCLAVAKDDRGSQEVAISALARDGGLSWRNRRVAQAGSGTVFSVSCPEPRWCMAGGGNSSGTLLNSTNIAGKR